MKYEKFLPLGSIVSIRKNRNIKIMISGFTIKNDKDVFDYIGCLYPVGFMGYEKMVLFNHEDIEKVHHLGYLDDEATGLKKALNGIISPQKYTES